MDVARAVAMDAADLSRKAPSNPAEPSCGAMPPVTTTSEESQASINGRPSLRLSINGRVMDTAKQMTRDNEIPKGILFKTPFSAELARRVGRSDSAKYITRN